jgi:outer membrane receptor protein involved in Fe transport
LSRTILAFLSVTTLAILPAAAFDGIVLLPDGKPAVDAGISIQEVEGSTRTDAQGKFHWTPDPPLPCQIQVILAQGQYAAPVKIDTLPSQGPVEVHVTPVISESVTVIASRVPESSTTVPASVTVVSGDDLRNRGARDLRTALAQVTGVDIAPGGDGGPASSVPEMWGLKEFDAFLLVVDGVPWGGAFNPDLESLSLASVDHIEVLRGAAPVTYGATSFVGVIEVFNTDPRDVKQNLEVTGGNYGSYGVRYDTPLPEWAGIQSSLNLDAGNVGYKDDRTDIERGHFLWKNRVAAGEGKFGFDVDGIWQHQNPASPTPLVGTELVTSQVPLDTNQNLSDAHINENRFALNLSYQHPTINGGTWLNTFSVYHSDQKTLRGFLEDVSNTNPNAHGFRADIPVTGAYLDSHVAFDIIKGLNVATGIDYLYGDGKATGGDFDYFVNLDGSNPPSGDQLPSQSDTVIKDRRNFAGAYGQFRWDPLKDWHFELGLRLNYTNETRSASSLEFSTNTLEEGSDSLSIWRGSGYAGVTWTAWSAGADTLAVYTDYRNTYKPAAVDFGLEPDFEILQPETAQSIEAGAKTRLLSGKLSLELSVFRMNFQNLVVPQDVGGVPELRNAGEERFRGFELASAWRVRSFLSMTAGYSFHDAKFQDFVTDESGSTLQLAGNQLPMSARNMANLGFVLSRDQGWRGNIQGNYIGSRFFDQENTVMAPAYTTLDAGVGYRMKSMELRLEGYNLTDVREPVSESELGDSQFYLMPARRIQLSLRWNIGT